MLPDSSKYRGRSQAGWIMPLAASQEPLISFIVSGEGVPITPHEERFTPGPRHITLTPNRP